MAGIVVVSLYALLIAFTLLALTTALPRHANATITYIAPTLTATATLTALAHAPATSASATDSFASEPWLDQVTWALIIYDVFTLLALFLAWTAGWLDGFKAEARVARQRLTYLHSPRFQREDDRIGREMRRLGML